jgi:NAD(P) transhydrogenase subunit alpha
VVTPSGVTIIGAPNLASDVPAAASSAYSRNVCAVLAHLIRDGELAIDLTDEIQAGIVVAHAGEVAHPALRRADGGDQGGAPSQPGNAPSPSAPDANQNQNEGGVRV